MASKTTASVPTSPAPTGPDRSDTRRRHRSTAVAVVAVATGIALAACGSSGGNTSSASAAASRSASTPSAPPGVSGTVAALDPANTTMEVQGTSGQTTVSWTTSTTFAQTVDVAITSVAPGDCVTATGTPPAGTSTSSSGSSGFAGTPITSMTATTVSVSAPPAGGTCTSRPTERSGSSSGLGSGGFGSGGRFSGGRFPGGFRPPASSGSSTTPRTTATASGTVQSVSGTDIVVQGFGRALTFVPGTRRLSSSARSSGSSARRPFSAPPTTTVTIATGSSTTFTETETASASDLAVGQCITAFGPAGQTGAVAATAISMRPAGPDGCTGFGAGLGGQFRGFGGPPGGATSTTS